MSKTIHQQDVHYSQLCTRLHKLHQVTWETSARLCCIALSIHAGGPSPTFNGRGHWWWRSPSPDRGWRWWRWRPASSWGCGGCWRRSTSWRSGRGTGSPSSWGWPGTTAAGGTPTSRTTTARKTTCCVTSVCCHIVGVWWIVTSANDSALKFGMIKTPPEMEAMKHGQTSDWGSPSTKLYELWEMKTMIRHGKCRSIGWTEDSRNQKYIL